MDIDCTSSPMSIPDAIVKRFRLDASEVEATFVYHKIMPQSTIVQRGDKATLVPPGGIPNHVVAYVGKNNA